VNNQLQLHYPVSCTLKVRIFNIDKQIYFNAALISLRTVLKQREGGIRGVSGGWLVFVFDRCSPTIKVKFNAAAVQ